MKQMTSPADVTERYQASWNAHDMALFATLFHPDATFVNRFGTHWKGADAIVEGHAAIHRTVYRDSVLRIDAPEVEYLTDDIAIVHFWNRLETGENFPGGGGSTDTLVLAVLTREDGEWRIRAAENVTLSDPRSGKAILRPG